MHIEDPALLPELIMVAYEAPDALAVETVTLDRLLDDWRSDEARTRQRGDTWHRRRATALLRVPSAVVPIAGSPDLNVLINHTHEDVSQIVMVAAEPFALDLRLFQAGRRPMLAPPLDIDPHSEGLLSNGSAGPLVVPKCIVQAR